MSFSDLKRNRDKQLEALTNKLTAPNNQQQKDDTYWSPTLGPDGNGSAIIRFLPAPPGEEDPYVQIFSHAFQTPFGWYIEKSLSTIGQADPVGELNARLWADDRKDEARKQKRNLKYHANIYVVKDPGNPENEGRNFKYAFGKKIFDKIKEAMSPTDDDEVAFNPFDFWEGANFRIRISQVKGADGKSYPNYDKSKFDSPSPLFTNDDGADEDKMKALWETQYSLQALIDPSQFKTYDELKKRLNKVLGLTGDSTPVQSAGTQQAAQTTAERFESSKSESQESSTEDDADDMAWFKELEDND